ncbi:MAG: hypothetical protein DRP08_07920 [Candidatus Aenigmatarchaeota archaeon]|nr:MAG: hypothetical protein DRP08_07920 [Candidatus Aenigmarchaeota archaeon]
MNYENICEYIPLQSIILKPFKFVIKEKNIMLYSLAWIGLLGLLITTLLSGFLLLTAVKKSIMKNAVAFITTFFIILFVRYEFYDLLGTFAINNLVLDFVFEVVIPVLAKLIILTLAIFGFAYFEGWKKEFFTKLEKYISSFLFAILLATFSHLFVVQSVIMSMRLTFEIGDLLLYFLEFFIPLVGASLIIYLFGAKNDELNKIRYLRLTGSIVLFIGPTLIFLCLISLT